jgi:NAD(P)H-dependent FMN reductase
MAAIARKGRVRLLLLSGSTRPSSTNAAALEAITRFNGVDAQLFDELAGLPTFNPDDDDEPLPAQVVALRESIARADALLICTPEYAGTLPGSFKNLLDWTVGGSEIGDSPVAWLSVAAVGRGDGAIVTLETVLGYVGADLIRNACARVPIGRSELDVDGRVVDPAILERLREVVDAVVSYVPATLEW